MTVESFYFLKLIKKQIYHALAILSNKETAAAACGKFLMDLAYAKNAEQVKVAIKLLVQKLQTLLESK